MGVDGDGDKAEGNSGLLIGGSGTDLEDCGTGGIMMLSVVLIDNLGSDTGIFLVGFGCTLGSFAGF